MKLSKGQQLMVDDGMPVELMLSQEQRAAAWERNPPRAMPAFSMIKHLDPVTLAALDELAEHKKLKTKVRIEKMLAKKAAPVDTRGKRWDPRTCKWVAMEKTKMDDTKQADETAAGTPAAETQNKESDPVAKVKKKKSAAKKAASSKKPAAAKKAVNGARKGSKTEVIAGLLTRKSGCTTADILKATGWPAVSVPAMAKAAGLKLRKDKIKGEVTRYFGS